MEYQILLSGENKKNVIISLSAELAQRVVKVKVCPYYMVISEYVTTIFPMI